MTQGVKALMAALAAVLATVGFGCGPPDTPGRVRAIEAAATERQGMLHFPTGVVRITRNLAFLKQAESNGLLTIREMPQSYWDSFLTQTQGMGTPYEIAPTQKLLAVATPSKENAEGGPSVLLVTAREAKLAETVEDQEYSGPLANPGENYRLLLGVVTMVPTQAARVLGTGVAHQDETRLRIRCVAKYSKFDKQWSVVAMDVGLPESQEWFTATVK